MRTDGVALRPLVMEDAEEMATLANNRRIWQNVRDQFPFPYLPEDARKFIGRCQEESSPSTFATTYQGQFCGAIGLEERQDIYRHCRELGYWVGEPYWNRGIATKAIALITEHAFRELGLHRVEASVLVHNVASRKALEKNGFQLEGTAIQGA